MVMTKQQQSKILLLQKKQKMSQKCKTRPILRIIKKMRLTASLKILRVRRSSTPNSLSRKT